MPVKADPFELGREAYRNGLSLSDNPFSETAVEDWIEWDGGWLYSGGNR